MPNYNLSPRTIQDSDTIGHGVIVGDPVTGAIKIGDGETKWSELRGAKQPTLWVPATEFTGVSGTATAAAVASSIPAWSLPDAATTLIGTTLPEVELRGWAVVSATVYWSPSTTGAGNVRFQVDATGVALSATAVAPASPTLATVASPAVVDRVVASALGNVTVPAGAVKAFRVGRVGADAADTTTALVRVVGLLLTRVS